jgi:hypothetical protein
VKPIRWILILLLLGTVYCALTVPAADDASTAYNESDTPANLVLPASTGVKLARPVADPVPLPQPSTEIAGGVRDATHTAVPAPKRQSAQSLLTLLCTFLI